MNHWDSIGRWVNTLLLFVVGVIVFDTLFRMLEAQETNFIVRVVRLLSTVLLLPFHGMFSENDYFQTAMVAVLGYAVVVGIALSVLRGLQASMPARSAADRGPLEDSRYARVRPVRPGTRSPRRAARTATGASPANEDRPQATTPRTTRRTEGPEPRSRGRRAPADGAARTRPEPDAPDSSASRQRGPGDRARVPAKRPTADPSGNGGAPVRDGAGPNGAAGERESRAAPEADERRPRAAEETEERRRDPMADREPSRQAGDTRAAAPDGPD